MRSSTAPSRSLRPAHRPPKAALPLVLLVSALFAALVLAGPASASAGVNPYAATLSQSPNLAAAAQAAGATFDPNTVISDKVFRFVGSMTQAQVQSFLAAQAGILKTYQAPDVNGVIKPASQIIWEAAQHWDVNPKVVLATLQKEQSLLTAMAPSAWALNEAMGCGVPDSGSVNTFYKGFGKQVWYGADSLSVDGKNWYAGITKKCSDGAVSPSNVSTYSLYTYTPWIAGNQLFWTVYWRYFGDPIGDVTPPVTTVSGVDSAWHAQAVTLSFTGADNTGGSGVAYTQYSLNGGKTWTRGNMVTVSAPLNHSADGAHTVTYRSVDNSGNVEAGKSCKVRIDTTAPATADNAGVAWHSKAVTVTLTAADPKPEASTGIVAGSSGVAYTEYSSDGGATWTRGTSFTVAAPADHSGDGPRQVLVRSADVAGNVASARTVTVRIDTRQPRTYSNWAATVARGHTASLRYYVSDARPGSPTATVVIKVRTLAGRSVKTITARGPVNSTLSTRFVCWLAKGHYRYFVYATDAAGNHQSAVGGNRLTVK